MKQAERFYDHHAADYESKFDKPLASRVKKMEEDAILDFLFRHFPPEGRLLELGCGTGIFTLPVAGRGYDLTALDISQKMLDESRRKLEAAGVANVSLLKADVDDLPELEPFNAVFGIGLLEYLDSPETFVKKAAELLRTGGVACFTGPTLSLNGLIYRAVSRFRKRIHMQLFTGGRLRRLFEGAGLRPLEIREIGFHLPLMKPLTRIGAARKEEIR